jgi:Predicted Zn-dependent protease (DUF2268)
MKKLLLLLLLFDQQKAFTQDNDGLKIIDLSQIELRLLNWGRHLDSAKRSQAYLDSLYRPYKQFWSGYAGEAADFLSWVNNEGVQFLDYLNKKNEKIDGSKLAGQFNEVKKNMYQLTGYTPKGEWYIVYFHGATNLGSLGTGEMVIDLSHQNNSTNEKIANAFPHEITHQIMNNVNRNKDTTALGSIVGEGFAVFVSNLYYGKKYSIAEHLGFTKDELAQCRKHHSDIKSFFEQNKFSTDPIIINKFRSRSEKINPALPGAIGYYIGYEIIKKYAEKNSWKEVFTKSPRVIYELSKY